MGVLTTPDVIQRPIPCASPVRSTTLAYRFMVRRTLCRRGGAQFRGAERVSRADLPARPEIAGIQRADAPQPARNRKDQLALNPKS